MNLKNAEITTENTGTHILLTVLRILVLRKVLIFSITFGVTLLAALLVLIPKSTYTSVAVIKPPVREGGSSIESVLKESAGPLAGALGSFIGGGESGVDDCITILGSARFAKLVIQKFDLETLYKFKTRKKYYFANVIKIFQRNSTFSTTEEGAIKISMDDDSAARAQEMVLFMIRTLDSLYTDIQRSSIKQKLGYIDERIVMAENAMKSIEDSLMAFQLKHNLYSPDLQVQSIFENAAKTELQADLLKEQLELEAALRGTNTSRYQSLTVERQLLKSSLKNKIRGNVDSNSLILPVHSVPSIANDYFRLERAYKVRLGVYKFLIQQGESLKLEAGKNIRAISVIDSPWINDKRIAPKRQIIVETFFVLSFIFSILIAILLTHWEKHKKNNSSEFQIAMDIKKNLFKF